MRTFDCDVAVAGGGVGGVASALAASRMGLRVVMTEETDWIGGQLTSQGVPPDEHGWIERFGCTRTYRRFREGVRDYYRRHYPLLPRQRDDPRLNPGNGWVSPLCHEPRVALAVLEAMLAPEVSAGRLLILRKHRIIAAEPDGAERTAAVTVRDMAAGEEAKIRAEYFIDATDAGDLLPLAGAEHVAGIGSAAGNRRTLGTGRGKAGQPPGFLRLLCLGTPRGRESHHPAAGKLRLLAGVCAGAHTGVARTAAELGRAQSQDDGTDAVSL